MKKSSIKAALTLLLVHALLYPSLPDGNSIRANSSEHALLADALKAICSCGDNFSWVAPQLDPSILPIDVSFNSNRNCVPGAGAKSGSCQECFDCFAWQLFIALNWRAASAGQPKLDAGFGDAGDYKAVVWETYKDVHEIFDDPNKKLLPWGSDNEGSRSVASTRVNKNFDSNQVDRNWLTDQNKKLVRYEIKINRDLYEYIRQNDLNNQEGLYAAFTSGDGVSLPDAASVYGDHGSIEIKAAWRVIPQADLDQYKAKYKISFARVPGEGNPGDAVPLALVGLHIIKKTPKSHQWIWATFEHKDNAPDLNGPVPEGIKWGFYNPEAPPGYKPNWVAPPNGSTPKDERVQVRREKSISMDAMNINNAVHELIRQRFKNSVWLNYVLVDVQWPKSPQRQSPKATRALASGTPVPRSVANTTMETYMQRGKHEKGPDGVYGIGGGYGEDEKSSCIGCHRLSSMTPVFDKKIKARFKARFNEVLVGWRTDYSTIFSRAKAKDPTP